MSNEMKRLTAPRSWPVKRKASHWITKPSPGAHAVEDSIPVNVVSATCCTFEDRGRGQGRSIF